MRCHIFFIKSFIRMILKRKHYKILLNEIASVIKIQKLFRKYMKIKLKRMRIAELKKKKENELKRKTEENELNRQPSIELKEMNENIEKKDKSYQNIEANQQNKDNINKKEKILKQKESIRNLYEPSLRKTNKLKPKLSKIQSNREFEENKQYETKLGKKASQPNIIKENASESSLKDDSFSHKLENTKKINNLIANSNTMMINNLTKIYGIDKKKEQINTKIHENKRMKTSEDQNINELFNFFHKKLGK